MFAEITLLYFLHLSVGINFKVGIIFVLVSGGSSPVCPINYIDFVPPQFPNELRIFLNFL